MVAMNPRALETVVRRSSAFEGGHGLQMECLWKQVYQGEGNGSIPGWLQRTQVAGQGGGVAGDVDDPGWLNGREALADLCAETSTRRIDYDEVWLLRWGRFEEVEGVLGDALVSLAMEAGEDSTAMTCSNCCASA